MNIMAKTWVFQAALCYQIHLDAQLVGEFLLYLNQFQQPHYFMEFDEHIQITALFVVAPCIRPENAYPLWPVRYE